MEYLSSSLNTMCLFFWEVQPSYVICNKLNNRHCLFFFPFFPFLSKIDGFLYKNMQIFSPSPHLPSISPFLCWYLDPMVWRAPLGTPLSPCSLESEGEFCMALSKSPPSLQEKRFQSMPKVQVSKPPLFVFSLFNRFPVPPSKTSSPPPPLGLSVQWSEGEKIKKKRKRKTSHFPLFSLQRSFPLG